MNYRIVTYLLTGIFIFIVTASPLHAQMDSNYFRGNQMLQQQNYEEAYNIFRDLYYENPTNFLFLDKATESLINLKRYDEAIQITQEAVESANYPGMASILLGEIYHIKGDTAQAYSAWDQVLQANNNNIQIYLEVARTMTDRRAFDKAVEVYERAQQRFSDSDVSADLANTYMQAGQYENAINEFLELVRWQPERVDYVQRSLIQFGDEFLHDIAILEIEEFLNQLPVTHPAHPRLHQLELWLLLERDLYERAVATARSYEERTNQVTYTLFALGDKLLSEREFELAEESYRYYIDNNIVPPKYQSMQELSEVYTEWANYLSDYNLAYTQQRDSLYQEAFDILQQLRDEAPNYQSMRQVVIRQAELAIDYLHDVELAKEYLENLQSMGENFASAGQEFYVEGRINLYESDYPRARIALTKSNNQEQIGEMAEKTRYYLALTDFYAGDYEFAKIQLNSLERQNTSNFANDAVQLRVWIQNGLNADSTGSIIEPFATGIEYFNQGKEEQAIQALAPVISVESYHPLMGETLLELSKHLSPDLVQTTYTAITNYLNRWGTASPLRERLLWEKARIADQVITNNLNVSIGETNLLENETASAQTELVSLPSDITELQNLYEDILLQFPNGFYASYARERLQELQSPQT